MTLILGIDPSAAKIAAVAVETLTGTFVVKAGKLYPKGTTKQTPESIGQALHFMRDFLQEIDPMVGSTQPLAFVELPLGGRGGLTTTIKQAYVGGIVRACLVEAGFAVYDANVSAWRGRFLGVKTGKGRTTNILKQETAKAVEVRDPKLYRLVSHDGDLTDAAGIALYGADTARKGAGLVAPQPPGSAVSGRGPGDVLRPPRVRRVVRRPPRLPDGEVGAR